MLIEIVHTEQVEAQELHQNITALRVAIRIEAAGRLLHVLLPIEVPEQERAMVVRTEVQHLEQVLLDHLERAEVALAEVLIEALEALQEVLEHTVLVVQAGLLDPALDLLDQVQDHRRHQVVETKSKIKSNLL